MEKRDIIVVGASAGGIEALSTVLRALPATMAAAMLIVNHLPAHVPSQLAQILARQSEPPVEQAQDGLPIRSGRIYVAPPDYHILLEPGVMRLLHGPKENRFRPAIDPLFRTAAKAYGSRVIGVVLTGSLDDGTAGLLAIKRHGGLAVVQDPAEALFPSMPRSAIRHVAVDHVVKLENLPALFNELTDSRHSGASPEAETPPPAPKAQRELERLQVDELAGTPSVFSCPECHGTLWEIQDETLTRYRCRTGHAFSPESMLGQQMETLEEALWSALKTLEEHTALLRRLADDSRGRNHQRIAAGFETRIQAAEARASVIRTVLLDGALTKPLEEFTESPRNTA